MLLCLSRGFPALLAAMYERCKCVRVSSLASPVRLFRATVTAPKSVREVLRMRALRIALALGLAFGVLGVATPAHADYGGGVLTVSFQPHGARVLGDLGDFGARYSAARGYGWLRRGVPHAVRNQMYITANGLTGVKVVGYHPPVWKWDSPCAQRCRVSVLVGDGDPTADTRVVINGTVVVADFRSTASEPDGFFSATVWVPKGPIYVSADPSSGQRANSRWMAVTATIPAGN